MHVRGLLSDRFGGCLLTEHGRMPVCHGAAGAADRHCFHAHFLMFPAAPSILGLAVPYFVNVTQHADLRSTPDWADVEDTPCPSGRLQDIGTRCAAAVG